MVEEVLLKVVGDSVFSQRKQSGDRVVSGRLPHLLDVAEEGRGCLAVHLHRGALSRVEILDLVDEQLHRVDHAEILELLVETRDPGGLGPAALLLLDAPSADKNAIVVRWGRVRVLGGRGTPLEAVLDRNAREVSGTPAQGPPHLDADVHREFVEVHVVDLDIMDVVVEVEEIPGAGKLLVLAAIEFCCSLLEFVDERGGVVDNAPEVADDGLGSLEGALLGSVFDLRG